MAKTASKALPQVAERFDVYSRLGRLLDSKATQVEAERLMGACFEAKYVVAVFPGGSSYVVSQRKELH